MLMEIGHERRHQAEDHLLRTEARRARRVAAKAATEAKAFRIKTPDGLKHVLANRGR